MSEQEFVIRAVGLAATMPGPKKPVFLYESLNLAVRGGESVSILGRSGSGKSTLLSTLGLMQRPQTGTLLLRGNDVSTIAEANAARLRNELIGFVFQNYSLVPHLSVLENVGIPLGYGRKVSRREGKRLVMQSLERVGLAARALERPLRLSGGEQQRVAIARALVRSPPIVLADEPTGALDTETAIQVLEVLRESTASAGSCLIVVTHDRVVSQATDRTYRLCSRGLELEATESGGQ